jgi:hypothetical protein
MLEFGGDGCGVATSTGGVAAVLIHRFRAKGLKKVVGVGRSEWTQKKEKES